MPAHAALKARCRQGYKNEKREMALSKSVVRLTVQQKHVTLREVFCIKLHKLRRTFGAWMA